MVMMMNDDGDDNEDDNDDDALLVVIFRNNNRAHGPRVRCAPYILHSSSCRAASRRVAQLERQDGTRWLG